MAPLTGPWVGDSGRAWSLLAEVPGGTPGIAFADVVDGVARGRLELCTSPDPSLRAAFAARARFFRVATGSPGLPVPPVLDQLLVSGDPGVVLEPWGEDLATWWAAAPGRERLTAVLRDLAELAEGLDRLDGFLSADPDAPPLWPLVGPRALHRGPRGALWGVALVPDPAAGPAMDGGADLWPPEVLFGATGAHRGSLGCWQVGMTLLQLLLTHPGRWATSGATLPTRARLIGDLHRAKPRLFAGRAIHAAEFLYPDALPDADRAGVREGLQRILQGAPPTGLETATLALLDGALAVDPGARQGSLKHAGQGLLELAELLAPRREPRPAPRDPAPAARPPAAALPAVGAAPAIADPPSPAPAPAPPAPRPAAPARGGGPGWGAFAVLAVLQMGTLAVALTALWGDRGSAAPEGAPVSVAPPPQTGRAAPPPSEEPASEDPPSVQPASEPDRMGDPQGAAAAEPPPAPAAERSEPPRARPKDPAAPPPPSEPEPPPAAGPGRLSVAGGTVSAAGEAGTFGPGELPAGRYRLRATPTGGAELDLGSVEVGAGAAVRVKCGFGTCRVEGG